MQTVQTKPNTHLLKYTVQGNQASAFFLKLQSVQYAGIYDIESCPYVLKHWKEVGGVRMQNTGTT